MSVHTRFVILVVAAAGVLVAASAGATATGLGKKGPIIHACAKKTGGALRLGTACHADERSVSWGQIGPAGTAGPAGPAGAVGAAGPIGPAGPQGTEGSVGPAGSAGSAGPAGPRGPAGPDGPAGLVGPAGPAGQAGVSGYEIVTALSASVNTNSFSPDVPATCPAGKKPIGGGVFTPDAMVLVDSFPDAASNSWQAGMLNVSSTSPGTFTVYAVCATA